MSIDSIAKIHLHFQGLPREKAALLIKPPIVVAGYFIAQWSL
jgi:hypothetical protein